MCFSLRFRGNCLSRKAFSFATIIALASAFGYGGWKYSRPSLNFVEGTAPGDGSRISLYFAQFRKDMETVSVFRGHVKFPDFCAKDWQCLSDQALDYPVHTVSGAVTLSTDFVTYSKHRKLSCMGDMKCERGVVVKFFSTVANIFRSIRPENLYAYQQNVDHSPMSHFIQLQEDALAIDYFNSMNENFNHYTDELRTAVTPEEFETIHEIYADLPSYPETHGFLVSKLSVEEIENVFAEIRRTTTDVKDIPKLRNTLLAYKKAMSGRAPASVTTSMIPQTPDEMSL